jgi:hypothetical protein
MKSKNDRHEPHQSPAMVEDEATEKLKKRAQSVGLIVNAGRTRGTLYSQTKTTQKLDQTVKRAADNRLGGKKRGKK